MKKILTLFIALSLAGSSFAAFPLTDRSKETSSIVIPAQVNTPNDKPQLKFKELKKIATDVKGSKLTLKEKILLKVFGKKLSKFYAGGGKSQLTAVLLCFFLGGLGIHRFYLGYTWQGIVQLLTLGGLGIWSLIDFIRILTGSLQPKDGEYEKTL
jgi:hypothetical protein